MKLPPRDARAAAERAQIYSVRDPLTKHGISVLKGFVPANALRLTHTSTHNKSMALLIFYRVTFVSNYHEGGAERPLANLSAVNYGNLPSCLSASAAGLPFVSKSKAPICNIGTFSFLQGQGAHKRLTTGDIYSRRSLRPPLQNAAHSSTWAKPTTWLRSTKPKPVRSGTGTSLCLSSGPVCAGVQRAWVTKGGEDKKYKNTQTQHLCWGGLIMGYLVGFYL